MYRCWYVKQITIIIFACSLFNNNRLLYKKKKYTNKLGTLNYSIS